MISRRSIIGLLPLIPLFSFYEKKREKILYLATNAILYDELKYCEITGDPLFRRLLGKSSNENSEFFDEMYVLEATVLEDGNLLISHWNHPYCENKCESPFIANDWSIIQYDEFGQITRVLTKKDYLI